LCSNGFVAVLVAMEVAVDMTAAAVEIIFIVVVYYILLYSIIDDGSIA